MAQWIARWTSNPTVAGSSPVKSVSLGSVAQNMFDRACVCGSHAVSLGSRRVHRSHYQLIRSSSNLILKLDRSSIACLCPLLSMANNYRTGPTQLRIDVGLNPTRTNDI